MCTDYDLFLLRTVISRFPNGWQNTRTQNNQSAKVPKIERIKLID